MVNDLDQKFPPSDPSLLVLRNDLMTDHIQGQTYHARRGRLRNAFRYGVDFVLFDPKQDHTPFLLSRNRFNLWSLHDKRHGGVRGDGIGVDWFYRELKARGCPTDGTRLLLLTQPSFLWFHFNPVSFWIALRDDQLIAFVAEVNNTFGHRHCYFCAHDDFRPITPSDRIEAQKMMHVSPFQEVAGSYAFNFALTPDRLNIRIDYRNGDQGVLATLTGARRRATNRSLIWASLRRPFGAARVVALIYWQALILWVKGAPFRRKPAPPEPLISESESFQGVK